MKADQIDTMGEEFVKGQPDKSLAGGAAKKYYANPAKVMGWIVAVVLVVLFIHHEGWSLSGISTRINASIGGSGTHHKVFLTPDWSVGYQADKWGFDIIEGWPLVMEVQDIDRDRIFPMPPGSRIDTSKIRTFRLRVTEKKGIEPVIIDLWTR